MVFVLESYIVLDWACCTGRKCLMRGKRNPHVGTNHKQIVWCQWVGSTILAKSRLKFWVMWLGYVAKQEFWSFWEKVETELWVMGFEFELWVMSYEYWHMKTKSWPNQTSPKCSERSILLLLISIFGKVKNIEEIGLINLGAIFRNTIEARLGAVVHNYQG